MTIFLFCTLTLNIYFSLIRGTLLGIIFFILKLWTFTFHAATYALNSYSFTSKDIE